MFLCLFMISKFFLTNKNNNNSDEGEAELLSIHLPKHFIRLQIIKFNFKCLSFTKHKLHRFACSCSLNVTCSVCCDWFGALKRVLSRVSRTHFAKMEKINKTTGLRLETSETREPHKNTTSTRLVVLY